MLALPSPEWSSEPLLEEQVRALAPFQGDWRRIGLVTHIFTHFSLTLEVWRSELAEADPQVCWTPVDKAAQSLPSVFRKALLLGLETQP